VANAVSPRRRIAGEMLRLVRTARQRVMPPGHLRVRNELARRYLRGRGLELGGLHRPLRVPPGCSVRYVDRLSVEELRVHYPELEGEPLVPVDVLDDGERLESVPDGSVDFVVANHFLEHCEDPLSALRAQLRVLRPGGVAFLALPDKRATFDAGRPETELAHVVRDYEEGPGWSRRAHFEEFARDAEHARDVEARVRQLLELDYSIHFHVWTPERFRELLDHARTQLRFPFETRAFRTSAEEFVLVLERTDEPLPPPPRAADGATSAARGSPASA
jgi:SAM-dependent methyltransferase